MQSKQSYITYDFLKGKKAYLEPFRCISRKSGDKEVSIHFHLELLLTLISNALLKLKCTFDVINILFAISLSLSLAFSLCLSLRLCLSRSLCLSPSLFLSLSLSSLSSVSLRPAIVSHRELDISHVRIADGILHTIYANRRKNKRLVKMRVHNITA